MSVKPKVALYWCASCGGCEESVVDLAEKILDVVDAVDIVLWPVAMDFKREDVEAYPDGSIDVALVNGAVRSSEQEEMAHLLRRKSRLVIAYGACAQLGGIPSLANLYPLEEALRDVYDESPSTVNPERTRPAPHHAENGHDVTLPELRRLVRSLDQVIEVDYAIPGCPPTPKLLGDALAAILAGRLPPKGTVLAPDVALCEECPRRDTKPETLAIREFRRPHLTAMDPETCFLAQGVLCMGPATRQGCGAQCIGGCMPCTGCFGPTSRVADQGAKILSFLASNIEPKSDEEIERVFDGIPDPVGTFYRYGLAASKLRASVAVKERPRHG
jgi:F420-non-reducing hydrogenase small subunit